MTLRIALIYVYFVVIGSAAITFIIYAMTR